MDRRIVMDQLNETPHSKENTQNQSKQDQSSKGSESSKSSEGKRSVLTGRAKRWVSFVVVIVFALIVIRLLNVWYQAHSKKTKAIPIGVLSSVIQNKDMPVYITALGNVSSYLSITVKTQINGQLLRVFFNEGQAVKKGDVLAEIDPRPYEAQLLQFQGQLARDQAILDNALIDLKRYEDLYKKDSVSQQTLETQRALVRQYQGIIQLDQGQIDQVKVNLIYCRITSPVDGRVGLRLVDPGNYVQVTDPTGLVVLNTVQPISVLFAIAEDLLQPVLQKIRNGAILIAEAYDRTQNKLLSLGTVATLDNQIDSSTGTVKLRALFQNEHNMLFPNQFVNIKLLVNTLKNSMVVPTIAIQQGSKGSYVYVLKEETAADPEKHKSTVNKSSIKKETIKQHFRAIAKPISVLVTEGNDSAIDGDLLPGQQVVTEGVDKLADHALVYIVNDKSKSVEPANTMSQDKTNDHSENKNGVGSSTTKHSLQNVYPIKRIRSVQKEDLKASQYFLLQLEDKFCNTNIILRKHIITRKKIDD